MGRVVPGHASAMIDRLRVKRIKSILGEMPFFVEPGLGGL